jgi:hypothetical protein
VAGWSLASSAGTLLFDPYFTRTSVDDDDTPLLPDLAAISAYAPLRANAVLVGHSHFDHLLDVPTIARRTGAKVVGSSSTANVARAGGVLAENILVANGGETWTIGPFTVHAVRGRHSLTGQADEPIPSQITLPLPARGYGEGGTLQYLVSLEGRTVFFVGTANFVEEELHGLRLGGLRPGGLRPGGLRPGGLGPGGLRPDVAVVAVGLRRKIPDYTCRLMRALNLPPLVLPNHFDEFREPLRPGAPPTEATRADLDAFAAEVHACAAATRVTIPLPLRPIAL